MKTRLILSVFALFSLLVFAGCPQTPPGQPPDTESTTVTTVETLKAEDSTLLDFGGVTLTEPEAVILTETIVVESMPATPPTPPASSQETPEEKVVRERTAQLGGSIQKNTDGRITRVIIENDNLKLEDAQAIGKLTSLEWIRLAAPSVDDDYVEALSGLVNLKIVDIENSNITDKSLEMLKALPEIHTLGLRRNEKLSDNAIKLFVDFPKLHTLRILYNGFSSASLFDLGNLKAIKILDLRALPVDDTALMFIGDLETLEEIHIRSGSVTNTGLKELARCPKLKILELQDTSVSAGSAEIFKEMKSLRSLRIFRAEKFGAEATAELGILTDLETLELRGVGGSNEALLALKPLVQLKTVEFSELPNVDSATVIDVLKCYPKLDRINIFGIPVDDTVASFLATVPTLRSVSLPATAITDKRLDALTALTELTLLDIHGNKERITLEGARVISKFSNLRRLIIPETLKELETEIPKVLPRCTVSIKTYSHET
jgi:Leucine-rich repeat (LRR) protein